MSDEVNYGHFVGTGDAIGIATSLLRDAGNAQDVTKYLGFYTPDATVTTNGQVWKEKAERERRAKAWVAEVKDLSFEVAAVEVSGGLAIVDGPYTATKWADGEKVGGRYVTVWKRQTDGVWKIRTETLAPEVAK